MRERTNYWKRLGGATTSRRHVLRGAGVGAAGLGTMSLVGCGNDDDAQDDVDVPEAAEGLEGNTQEIDVDLETFREMYHGRNLRELPHAGDQPERGGTFRFAFVAPSSWDPTGPAAGTLPSYLLMHNQLIRFKVGDDVENHNLQEVEGDIAESMPEQPDELTYTFRLNPNVTFADLDPVNGRQLTAEDIKYCFEVYSEAPVQAPTFDHVESIDTPDDETLVVTTSEPAAYFLNSLVLPYHWIFSPEQHDEGGMERNPVGSGPYTLESEEDLGGYVAVRNPDYWKEDAHGTQLPYLDRIEVEYIPAPVDADAAFRQGQIDHRVPTNYDSWRDIVQSNPNVVTQVTTPPPSAHPFIVMNLDNPPFDDVRVRRAMALSVDRDSIIDSLAGGMAAYSYGQDFTYFGREWPWEPEELGDWHNYNPELAKELMAEAGYPDGIDRPLECFTAYTSGLWFDVSAAAFNQWREIGIEVDHQYSADQSQWQSQYFQTNYDDMMGINFIGPGWDPDAFTYQALHSQSPRNYFHVNDPDLDRLTEQQRHEMDVDARQEILREIMDIDLDQVYRLWLIMTYKINVRHPHVYNLADTLAAWSPVGWGSLNLEQTWLLGGGDGA